MGVRTSVDIAVRAGFDNDLANTVFDRALAELVDSFDHATVISGDLAASEANVQLDKGDITTIRLIYIEAEGELQVYTGGAPATTASLIGVGGTYPTTFAGGETLDLTIDGVSFTVTFDVADQTLAQVINRINAASAFAGINGLIASNSGGELLLTSQTSGSGSEVTIVTGTAVATLGFTDGQTDTGDDPTPNQAPFNLHRSANVSDANAVASLKAYLLASISTDNIFITNPSPSAAVKYRVLMVGDLTPADPC
jgi:flagellar capping protein FliD